MTSGIFLFTSFLHGADWKAPTREGVSDYKDGRYDKASADFERAGNLSANNPTVQFNKGCTAFKLKDYESATQSFEQSKVADKKSTAKADSLYNLGNTYLASGKTDAAIEAYKEAIFLNPKDPDIKHNLALALKQKPPQEKQEKKDNSNQDKKQNQDQNDKDKKEQQSKQQQSQMSPEQLESLMQAFQNEEMNQAKKMQKRKTAQISSTEEDW